MFGGRLDRGMSTCLWLCDQGNQGRGAVMTVVAAVLAR